MKDKKNEPIRGWLYCPECPAGQIFEGAEYATAVDDGWQDTPPSADDIKASEAEANDNAEHTVIEQLEEAVKILQTELDELQKLDADALTKQVADLTEQVHELEGQNATVRGTLKIEIAAHKDTKAELTKTKSALTKATKAATQ